MALSPRLEVRQTQSLTLTPQLMASIRLLQLSHLELNAFVEAELEKNPLLEREEGVPEPVTDSDQRPPSADEDSLDHTSREASAESIAANYDTEVENIFPDQAQADQQQVASTQWLERGGLSDSTEAPDLDQFVAARPTLTDHLTTQIGMILTDPGERLIAQFLTNSLSETGYLTVDLETVATQLGADIAMVEAVLLKLHGCEPLGVFARDLAECLAIQLRDKDRFDPLMARLLTHLELLAAHDMPALLRAIGCDREDLAGMLAELRALDPKPGLAFEAAPIEAIVPDVFVRARPDGSWVVELNADVLPRVLVNRVYYATVSKKLRAPAEKAFMVDCMNAANWLAKSLDQRAQTILKTAAEIVKQQDGFFVHGVTHLKPMTLRLVADAIEMHESTISRVTANKYMATPRGLFEMKYFFTTGLSSTTGAADHSSEAVRHRIRHLIEAEAPNAILSDDTIAETLGREQGIEVARRTVAKYREAMNIASSVIRRRQKNSAPAL